MSQPTPFAGLTALTPGEPLSDNGYAFQWGDRFLIDRLLRIGVLTHHHDGHAALAQPTDAPVVAAPSSGGQIPANQGIYVCYTWIDGNGGETMGTDPVSVTTAASIGDPQGAPEGTVDYTTGALLAGTWSYAVTLTDGLGGESALGPSVDITVEPGSPTAQIALAGLTAIMTAANPDSLSGIGWRMWRQAEEGPWYLVGTGNGDAFTDGGVAGDCTVAPPDASTLGGTSSLTVQVPAPAGGTDPMPTQFAIYASPDGSFISPALLGLYPIADAGTVKTYIDLTVSDGAPPPVSTSFGGAAKIDALTDIDNLYWHAPVATEADLPSAGNVTGDTRVTLDLFHIFIWTGTLWHDATTGGGGGSGGLKPSVATWADLPAGEFGDLRMVADKSTMAVCANTGGAVTPDDWWEVYAPFSDDQGLIDPDTQIKFGWRTPRNHDLLPIPARYGDAIITPDTHELYVVLNPTGATAESDWTLIVGGGGGGTRGSLWYAYTGSGTPAAGTFPGEADGDFAVRESDGEIFERVSGAWTDQSFTIRGTSGTAGARGSLWYDYTGSGTPATGTFSGEANGDFAVRESDGEVFKRVAGAWVDQTFSIRGPAGTGGGTVTHAAARGYMASTTFTPTANTWVKVPIDTASFDSGSNLDLTNHRYTCPVAGFYQVNAQVQVPAGGLVASAIYKNGVIAVVGGSTNGANPQRSTAADVMQCAAGDHLEVWVFNANGNTMNLGNVGADQYLSVALVEAI